VYPPTRMFVASHTPSRSTLAQASSFQQSIVGCLGCSPTALQNDHFLVSILMLFIWHVAVGQSHAPEASRAPARSVSKLKPMELDAKYTIQIPDYFMVGRISGQIAAVPIYFFNAPPPHYTRIQASISPYAGVISIDKESGKIKLPLAADDGTPLTNYFTISGNRDVYYGWSVVDNAYECTANSKCPLAWPPESRYTTRYAFAVFDKPNNSIVEFTGSHDGPSKKVTEFEGDGKLLRNTIVPSLTSIRQSQ
jgi:hypothetical protein